MLSFTSKCVRFVVASSLSLFAIFAMTERADAVAISPTSATEVTSVADGGFPPSNIIDGNNASDFNTVPNGGDYFGAGTPPVVRLDLGSVQTLDRVIFNNRNNNNENATRTFDVRFSTTPVFAGAPQSFSASYISNTQIQTFDLASPVSAQYVELTLTDNYNGLTSDAGGDRVGAAEIAFNQVVDNQLVTPTSINQTQATAFFPAANLIDDSGLSAAPTIDNYESLTHSPTNGSTAWVSNAAGSNYFDPVAGPDPIFEFDLGDTFDLTDLVVWGYGGNTNEASDFTVEFSRDGGSSYYDSVDVATVALLGTGNATLSFGDVFDADFVRVTITDNADGRGFSGAGGDRVGFGELKFIALAAATAPEPSTLVLAVMSICGLGVVRRRRNRNS